MTTKQPARSRGFTLIEVVVFVAIFGTSIVLIMASVSYSALGLKSAQLKISAAHAAEELAEWVKYQEDSSGFATILSKSSVGGTTYCFNDTTMNWPASGPCTSYTFAGIFKRELLLQNSLGASELTAQITTYWNMVGIIKNTRLTMILTSH